MPKPQDKFKALNTIHQFTRTFSAPAKVYRTLKVINDEGLGTEVDFGYRIKQFKCKNGCEHHNHLVCVMCGVATYLDNTLLEDLQDKLAKENTFIPKKHNFQMFGVCKNCR